MQIKCTCTFSCPHFLYAENAQRNVTGKCNGNANLRESELQALVVSVVELLEQLPGLRVPAEKTFHCPVLPIPRNFVEVFLKKDYLPLASAFFLFCCK
jgi:hypothetical protein